MEQTPLDTSQHFWWRLLLEKLLQEHLRLKPNKEDIYPAHVFSYPSFVAAAGQEVHTGILQRDWFTLDFIQL